MIGKLLRVAILAAAVGFVVNTVKKVTGRSDDSAAA